MQVQFMDSWVVCLGIATLRESVRTQASLAVWVVAWMERARP